MAETQYFLLPGPTQLPPRVVRAGSAPMVSHRGPEFVEIFTQMTNDMKDIYRTENDLLTLTCSGTGGLEAAAVNFINPGDKILVASIGNFGSRFRDICARYGADIDYLEFPWGQAVEPQAIADKLAADKDHQIKAVLVQHNETSTGVYNPLKEISQARGAHPALLLVDAISGMGALPLETDDWDLDVVISGSQKAFMSPPGLSFISVSPRAWEVQENNIQPKYYFDLANAKKFMNKGQTPATPAVSLIYAVAEALQMMKEKGLDNIIDQHFFRRDVVRAGAEAIGIKPLADISCASGAVTALCVPEGITPSQLTKPMRSKYNTVVAGGMGKIKESTFRIGHLGYMNDLDLIAVLAALEMVLWEAGHKFQLGSGVAAAQRLMMERYK